MNKINIKNYIGEIFTAIIVIALVIYSFVGIGVRESLNQDFWTAFAVNFGVMILVTSVWYPSAKQKAQFADKGYIEQRRRYTELVDKVVETNNQKGLARFCEYATEQNKICKIKQELIKINVDYDIFLKYKDEPSKIGTDSEIELTKKQQIKLRKLIENGVKVKKIDYARIITGIKNSKLTYDTSSGEQKYDVIKLTTKVIISVCSSIFMAYIVFSLFGFSWASVAQLSMWLIMIMWNIFTSYNTGYKSISVKRTDYYKKLKTFLEEFISSEYFVTKTQIQLPEETQKISENSTNKNEEIG